MENTMIRSALATARAALELIDERVARPPDPNCSCHISPPCNDCVKHAGEREAFEFVDEALEKFRALDAHNV